MDWKKVGYYAKYGLYVLPFYGMIAEYRKPKEEKSKIGLNVSKSITTGFLVKLSVFSVYTLIKGGFTGDWNPIHFGSKDKKVNSLEINKEIKKENELEKTVTWEELPK